MNSATKTRTQIEKLDVAAMVSAPAGTIFELPGGCLYRVSGNKMVIRMTKRTANGQELKAGEAQFLA
jgi:hypothetical protein